MELFLARFHFFLLMTSALWQTTCTSDCSYYTFYNMDNTWQEGQKQCQANGGELLSMETEQEYSFINKTIQGRDEGSNEWYIGLRMNAGDWKWISGHKLTISKWQPGEPSGDKYGHCAIMAKNWPPGKYGLFNDLICDTQRMFICEYKNATAIPRNINVTEFCPHGKENAIPTLATIHDTTTHGHGITTEKSIFNKLTSLSMSYTYASPNPQPVKTSNPKNASKGFPTMVVAILLGILLAFGICIFFVVFWWLKRKSGNAKSRSKPWKSPVISTPIAEEDNCLPQNGLHTGPTTTEHIQSTEPDSVLYAEIDDIYLQPVDTPISSTHTKVEYANSPSPTTPSGYAKLLQNPIYQNQTPYQPLNKYPEEEEEDLDEIAI